MLALAQYRASRCPRCSGDIAVTADPKNEGRFRHEPPVQCFRCLAFARAEDAAAGEKHAHTLLQIVPRKPNVK